jgi:hypothetical protein
MPVLKISRDGWEKAERFFDSMAAVPRERDEKKNQAAIPLRMTPLLVGLEGGAASGTSRFDTDVEAPTP